MNGEPTTKRIKRIHVDLDKCIGCRACEMACSAYHAKPRYSSTNPARSRIRVVVDLVNDEYVPIRATEFTRFECDGRQTYSINGKRYSECSFCGASCPSRDLFKEPDSGLPLKCDLCEDDPPLTEPACVQVCRVGALTYEECDEEVRNGQPRRGEVEVGLQALVERHGFGKLTDALARMAARA